MPSGNALQVSEITADSQLDELRAEWEDLLSRSRNAGVFQTWEWISCCREHFGRGRRLLVLCVREEGRLVGIAPLEIASMYGAPFRRLQFIGTMLSDYLDFILDSAVEQAALGAVCAWIKAHDAEWDLLDLQQIPQGSPTPGLLKQDSEFGSTMESMEQEICPHLPLAETWDGMMASFGKKMRWNIGYYERLMRREFEFAVGLLPQEEQDEGMDAFFDLHAKRWRRRWLPGMLAGRRIQRFHRDVAWHFEKKGRLRLYGLRLDGKLQSVLYCFRFKDKQYYYLGGFEPELARYSMGTVLTAYAVRTAVEEGCREFDFLRGNEPYKSRWTDAHRTNLRLIACKPTMRSSCARSVCRLERRIEYSAKEWLHKRLGG